MLSTNSRERRKSIINSMRLMEEGVSIVGVDEEFKNTIEIPKFFHLSDNISHKMDISTSQYNLREKFFSTEKKLAEKSIPKLVENIFQFNEELNSRIDKSGEKLLNEITSHYVMSICGSEKKGRGILRLKSKSICDREKYVIEKYFNREVDLFLDSIRNKKLLGIEFVPILKKYINECNEMFKKLLHFSSTFQIMIENVKSNYILREKEKERDVQLKQQYDVCIAMMERKLNQCKKKIKEQTLNMKNEIEGERRDVFFKRLKIKVDAVRDDIDKEKRELIRACRRKIKKKDKLIEKLNEKYENLCRIEKDKNLLKEEEKKEKTRIDVLEAFGFFQKRRNRKKKKKRVDGMSSKRMKKMKTSLADRIQRVLYRNKIRKNTLGSLKNLEIRKTKRKRALTLSLSPVPKYLQAKKNLSKRMNQFRKN